MGQNRRCNRLIRNLDGSFLSARPAEVAAGVTKFGTFLPKNRLHVGNDVFMWA
jgi:hypothetical protein